jgi:hypothetical protein
MTWIGPIELWNYPDAKKLGETFTADDSFPHPVVTNEGLILLDRDGRLFLSNVETGEVVKELEHLSLAGANVMRHRRNRLLYQVGRDLRVFSCDEDRIILIIPEFTGVRSATDDFAAVSKFAATSQPGHVTEKVVLVDLRAGKFDSRFDSLGHVSDGKLSEDGRYVALTAGLRVHVCDLSSGQVLWTLPLPPAPASYRFTKGGDELTLEVVDGSHRLHAACWKSAEGSVIVPLPTVFSGSAKRFPSSDGRFAVDYVVWKQTRVEQVFRHVRAKVDGWLGLTPSRQADFVGRTQLIDLANERWLGTVADDVVPTFVLPNGQGFLIATRLDSGEQRLDYFAFPPHRNWRWLITWGLGPVAVVVSLICVVARWCRRKVTRTTSVAA